MKFSPIFIFLFLLVLTPFIFAQPPAQVNLNIDTGIGIEFTKIEVFENNQVHFFNVHAFNRSDGVRLTNATTQCFLHLFDNTGFHVVNQVEMEFDTLGLDWDLNITGGNFTRNGEYSTLVTCNATTIGGFASFGFEVTQDGLANVVFPQQFSVIALGIILIMFGLLNPRYNLMKSMGSMFLMVMGILTLFPGYNNISHTSLFGLVLGSILIVMGFWFLIEDAFSRTSQEERFHQDQGIQEEDEES